MVIRQRRAEGLERLQLRWFTSAVGLVVVLVVAQGMVFLRYESGTALPPWATVISYLGIVSSAVLPLAVGIAILRYRLYDIDRIINRTLVYGALTAILVLAYVGSVVLLGGLLRPVTGSNDLAVAGSTLAVAALFAPARRRIQAFVDRRFYRSRYDAARTVEAFSARLRDEVDLDTLTRDLQGVVRDTLQPTSVSVCCESRRGGAVRSPITVEGPRLVPAQAISLQASSLQRNLPSTRRAPGESWEPQIGRTRVRCSSN